MREIPLSHVRTLSISPSLCLSVSFSRYPSLSLWLSLLSHSVFLSGSFLKMAVFPCRSFRSTDCSTGSFLRTHTHATTTKSKIVLSYMKCLIAVHSPWTYENPVAWNQESNYSMGVLELARGVCMCV